MDPRDLSLAEYARVQAHLLERHPLEDVLSLLGLDERRWSSAEQAWKQRIAADPTLLPVYTRELDRAVDALERRIKPLDDDAAAWLTFHAVYATQNEPVAWLERHGLGPNDLARLERLWARRCRDDGDVAKRFDELKKDAAGRALPNVVVDPRRPLRAGVVDERATDPRSRSVDEPSGAPAARVDLDGTAELAGQVMAMPLPFRPATSQDAERMAQRPAESSRPPGDARSKFAGTAELPLAARAGLPFAGRGPADSAHLDGTVEAPGGVLAAALPFTGTSSPLAAPAPSGPAPAYDGGSIVTTLPWRDGDGRLRTTIVGKLCLYLQAGAPPLLVPSDPFIAFDRLAADRRFVEAASEMAPWTASPSIITYGGPLRFTFHPTTGEPLQVTAAQGAPVGRSMSNPERAQYAATTPKRGADGILTIPEGVDGRYFVATPSAQHTVTIVGNERVVLEVGGARFDVKLPAQVIVVAVEIGGQRRQVTLPFDTLAVHGDRRRIALVGRATLPGEARLVGHRLASLHGAASPAATSSPGSRPPRGGPLAGTAAFDAAAALRAAGLPVMPFESRRSEPNLVPPAPPPPPPPPDETPEQPHARFEPPAEPQPPPPPKPVPKPVIARPKPGAMAKPRIKKR